MSVAALVLGGIACLVLTLMAVAFWTDPDKGMVRTTHRVELLPRVLADRYTAFALLGLFATVYGDLNVLAAFFAVCALMGFCDGRIYAVAGHPHIKHTISGVLSIVALVVTLTAAALEKGT